MGCTADAPRAPTPETSQIGDASVKLRAGGADRSNMTVQSIFTSRAVTRLIEAGNSATCVVCKLPVKFRAKSRLQQVIANVYNDGVWNRVEHYHLDCYENAGQPYGPAS